MATAREILANMFEHTIDSFNAINMFPRKERGPDKGSIEWPSFYAESIYTPILNQEGELVDRKFSTQKFLKKTGIFLAGLTLLGLIIAGLVFTGGMPAIGLMVLYGLGAIAGAIALPGVYFTAKVALRSVAKLAWTVVAGPISDVLDGVLHKLPKAIYRGIKNRVKTIQSSKRLHSVDNRSDIKFRVSKDDKGQQVYTTSVNLDTLPENQQELALRALVRSAAAFHKENHEGPFKIEVLYTDENTRKTNQRVDANIIDNELRRIKSSAGPKGSPATFKVKEDPEGKRVYTPIKEWGSLNSTAKEQVVQDILAFEAREKSKDPQAASRPRSIIDIGTKDPNATRELSEMVARLKGAPQDASAPLPRPPGPIDPVLHQTMGPPPQMAAQDPTRARPPLPPSPTNPKGAQLERDKVAPPHAKGPHTRRPGL